jgi:hypothetical protein
MGYVPVKNYIHPQTVSSQPLWSRQINVPRLPLSAHHCNHRSGMANPTSVHAPAFTFYLRQITFDNSTAFSMRDLCSHVEQSDALLGVLTVEETLRFAARLR